MISHLIKQRLLKVAYREYIFIFIFDADILEKGCYCVLEYWQQPLLFDTAATLGHSNGG